MRLSEEIKQVFAGEHQKVSFAKVLDKIDAKSFGFLIIILSLPIALPFTPPGMSTPFGLVLILIAWQMIKGQEYPWFPEKMLHVEIDTDKNKKFINLLIRISKFFERFLRPRFRFIYTGKLSQLWIGVLVLLCAIVMCIPIPTTNSLPAVATTLLGLGLLEEDGVFGLLGVITAILAIVYAIFLLSLIAFFGFTAVDSFKEWLTASVF